MDIKDIDFRVGNIFDIDQILKISELYIKETASFTNNISDVTRYLKDHLSYEIIEKELTSTSSYFYVAYYKDILIGYMKLNDYENRSLFIKQLDNYFQIQRLFILPEYQKEDIQNEFIKLALNKAKSLGYKDIIIDLYENNKRDIDLFNSNGFINFFEFDYKMGSMNRHNVVLKKEIY